MISGISQKVILPIFLLINFIPLGKTSDFNKNNYSKKNLNDQLIYYRNFKDLTLSPSDYFITQKQINFREYIKQDLDVQNYSIPLLVSYSEKKEELIIQSDIQS